MHVTVYKNSLIHGSVISFLTNVILQSKFKVKIHPQGISKGFTQNFMNASKIIATSLAVLVVHGSWEALVLMEKTQVIEIRLRYFFFFFFGFRTD